MNLLSMYKEYGKRKLGFPYPEATPSQREASQEVMDFAKPPAEFLPNPDQRQYLIDTLKVTVTGLIGGAVQRILGNK